MDESEQTAADGERLLTAREVAKRYGIARPTAWRWAKLGRIPAPIKGFDGRWRASDIDAHIRSLKLEELKEAAT